MGIRKKVGWDNEEWTHVGLSKDYWMIVVNLLFQNEGGEFLS